MRPNGPGALLYSYGTENDKMARKWITGSPRPRPKRLTRNHIRRTEIRILQRQSAIGVGGLNRSDRSCLRHTSKCVWTKSQSTLVIDSSPQRPQGTKTSQTDCTYCSSCSCHGERTKGLAKCWRGICCAFRFAGLQIFRPL